LPNADWSNRRQGDHRHQLFIVLLTKTGPRCISFRCKVTVSLAQGAVHDAEADVADPVFVRSTIPPSVRICTTRAPRQYTGPAADALHTPTGATTGTAGPRRDGVAYGGGGGAGAAYGTGCVAAECFHFATGTGRARTAGSQAAVAPEKAANGSLPAAVGREAARCRPWHLVVADDRCQRRKPVRGGDGRQRQRRSRWPPRWHSDKLKKAQAQRTASARATSERWCEGMFKKSIS